MANGRVTTGFSMPYVALYSVSGQTVTYTSGQALARGVDVSLDVEASTDNIFYADNQEAETAAGSFTGGTVTLTVDGLKQAAEKLILGLPEAGDDGFTAYGSAQAIPYVGLGFVVRYMEDGAISYLPVVLPKVIFANPGIDAATQEAEIDWQTQELEATIVRDDTTGRNWLYKGTAVETEDAAVSAIRTKLGLSATG